MIAPVVLACAGGLMAQTPQVPPGTLRGQVMDSSGGSVANAKVQVYGDVAILSYNFVGVAKDKDGKTEPTRAKSTRVYVKKGGQWWLVHANFGADD